jgi:hypothetical protein
VAGSGDKRVFKFAGRNYFWRLQTEIKGEIFPLGFDVRRANDNSFYTKICRYGNADNTFSQTDYIGDNATGMLPEHGKAVIYRVGLVGKVHVLNVLVTGKPRRGFYCFGVCLEIFV